MRSFFGNQDKAGGSGNTTKTPRHSSGWAQLLTHLRANESLRILDIGPTSSSNINYITGLGHSVYMANLAEEAARPEWLVAGEPGEASHYDVDGFIKSNLDFSGRIFDVVILWDAADYLPEPLLAPIMDRLHEVMQSGGKMLAFFHSKNTGPEVAFRRYHLTDTDVVDMQLTGSQPLLHTFNNRQIEKLLEKFSGTKFFLAKDSLREVVANR
ncbi:methyltransferase domain-containing protein [Granulicella arctica]|uniref:SAM-dependent methyltransferase n=1 Tax=Granulicella arctica TaxID=940613 RepID=UPI0021DF449D|nr:SAM-dependent methyltransferase [Granulicella arctica]